MWLPAISKEVAVPRNLLSALPMDFLMRTALKQEINAESGMLLAAVEGWGAELLFSLPV